MDEQKKNRLAAAVTVNVILLIVILAAVLIYTLAEVAIKAKYANELKKEIATYEQLIEDGEKTLEDLQDDNHLMALALLNHYVFKSDTNG